MTRFRSGAVICAAFSVVWVAACSDTAGSTTEPVNNTPEGGAAEAAVPDAGCPTGQAACAGQCIDVTADDANCGGCGVACAAASHCVAGACKASNIQHVVLVVEENHTFDAYFGRYCEAPAGSNPTCTTGTKCCERAPDKEPHGAAPVLLDDAANFGNDRDHAQACEIQQINGGKMDGYVTGSSGASTCAGSGPKCSSTNNFALSDQKTVGDYWLLADQNALADRYFQPIAGGTASNNMYFATAHYQFTDNDRLPTAVGTPFGCAAGFCLTGSQVNYQGRKTVADVLIGAQKTFAIYADGYAHALSEAPKCETIPNDCTYSVIAHPVAAQACRFDASDIPFNYYSQFSDGSHTKDFKQLATDVATNALPTFSYVKAREFRNEHPNVSNISDGVAFVKGVVGLIEGSAYASDTLVLLTWDEGGGFYDHVAPPPSIDTDDNGAPVPYGTRVPFMAIGKFARKGTVSHVQFEHSSVVRFLEYNFTGQVGQLQGSDAKVHNLGSLLDPAQTGITIPE